MVVDETVVAGVAGVMGMVGLVGDRGHLNLGPVVSTDEREKAGETVLLRCSSALRVLSRLGRTGCVPVRTSCLMAEEKPALEGAVGAGAGIALVSGDTEAVATVRDG